MKSSRYEQTFVTRYLAATPARQAGAEHGTPFPTAGVADEVLTKAEQLGYIHRDIAAVHDLLAHLSDNAAAVTS